MAKGLLLPLSVNKKGGAKTLEGTSYTEQVIRSGITPNLSLNPFQPGNGVKIGLSERIVFSNNIPRIQGFAKRNIINFFTRLRMAGICKLSPGSEGLSFTIKNEELTANIKYIDLESDKEGELFSNMIDSLNPLSDIG